MSKKGITLLSGIIVIIFVLFVSPYNPVQDLNPDHILDDPTFPGYFKNSQIEKIDYRGAHTYLIETSKKDFIVIQDYYSVMNYRWLVYEKAGVENFTLPGRKKEE